MAYKFNPFTGNFDEVTDVAALGFGTGVDERLVRWDGASAVQSSVVTLDDSGNMSGILDLTVDSEINIPTFDGANGRINLNAGKTTYICDFTGSFFLVVGAYSLTYATTNILSISAGGSFKIGNNTYSNAGLVFNVGANTTQALTPDDAFQIRSGELTAGGRALLDISEAGSATRPLLTVGSNGGSWLTVYQTAVSLMSKLTVGESGITTLVNNGAEWTTNGSTGWAFDTGGAIIGDSYVFQANNADVMTLSSTKAEMPGTIDRTSSGALTIGSTNTTDLALEPTADVTSTRPIKFSSSTTQIGSLLDRTASGVLTIGGANSTDLALEPTANVTSTRPIQFSNALVQIGSVLDRTASGALTIGAGNTTNLVLAPSADITSTRPLLLSSATPLSVTNSAPIISFGDNPTGTLNVNRTFIFEYPNQATVSSNGLWKFQNKKTGGTPATNFYQIQVGQAGTTTITNSAGSMSITGTSGLTLATTSGSLLFNNATDGGSIQMNSTSKDIDWIVNAKVQGTGTTGFFQIDSGAGFLGVGGTGTGGWMSALFHVRPINTYTASVETSSVFIDTRATPGQTFDTTFADQRFVRIASSFMNISVGITITRATSFYVEGSPTNAGAGTLTTSYAMWIDSGVSRFDGNIDLSANAVDIVLDTGTGTKIGTGITQKLGFWNATPVIQDTGWTITNKTSDRVLDCNSTSIDELADVVGTLVDQLKSYGLLGA